jgi:hypothetical protein
VRPEGAPGASFGAAGFFFAGPGFGFGEVAVPRPGFGFESGLFPRAGLLTAARPGAAVCVRARIVFSAGVRTISPRWRRADLSVDSSVAASAKGTSFAARRSTVAGSGIERPVAASSGTGRQTPRKSRMRWNTAGMSDWAAGPSLNLGTPRCPYLPRMGDEASDPYGPITES